MTLEGPLWDTDNKTWIGILIALLSAALSSLGVNLQALGLSRKREELTATTTRPVNHEQHESSSHLDLPENISGSERIPSQLSEGPSSPGTDKAVESSQRGTAKLNSSTAGPSTLSETVDPTIAPSISSPRRIKPQEALAQQIPDLEGIWSETRDSESDPLLPTQPHSARPHPIQTQAHTCFPLKNDTLIWYIGFLIYISCEMFGSVFALVFISPVLLAPLGSAGPIFNIFFSKLFLGTKIGIWDWVGTLLIVIGCSIVSLFGSQLPDGGASLN